MSKFWILAVFLTTGWSACKNQPSSEKRIEEIDVNSNAQLIRNPVSADGLKDTANLAKLTFEEETFDFGVVNEGAQVTHLFKFKNTGVIPLLISDVRSTCGCTIPEWSKEPIAPGENSEIKVRLNTQGKSNKQLKPITITANTYPAETKIYLTGDVKEAKK